MIIEAAIKINTKDGKAFNYSNKVGSYKFSVNVGERTIQTSGVPVYGETIFDAKYPNLDSRIKDEQGLGNIWKKITPAYFNEKATNISRVATGNGINLIAYADGSIEATKDFIAYTSVRASTSDAPSIVKFIKERNLFVVYSVAGQMATITFKDQTDLSKFSLIVSATTYPLLMTDLTYSKKFDRFIMCVRVATGTPKIYGEDSNLRGNFAEITSVTNLISSNSLVFTDFNKVIWDAKNSVFVLTAKDQASFFISSDGVTWALKSFASVSSSTNYAYNYVSYGDGVIVFYGNSTVAGNFGGGVVSRTLVPMAYSEDGCKSIKDLIITGSNITSASVKSIEYYDGRFYAIGAWASSFTAATSGNIFISPDGKSWRGFSTIDSSSVNGLSRNTYLGFLNRKVFLKDETNTEYFLSDDQQGYLMSDFYRLSYSVDENKEGYLDAGNGDDILSEYSSNNFDNLRSKTLFKIKNDSISSIVLTNVAKPAGYDTMWGQERFTENNEFVLYSDGSSVLNSSIARFDISQFHK